MNRTTIINVMKKYAFYNHLSFGDQRRINRAKQRGLSNILRQNKKDSFRVSISVKFYYFLSVIFKNITLKQSIHVMNSTGAMLLIAAVLSIMLKTGFYRNVSNQISPVIEAKVILLQGDVTVKGSDNVVNNTKLNSILNKGDLLITGPSSVVDISTEKNIVTRIGSGTKAAVGSIPRNGTTEFIIEEGIIFSTGNHQSSKTIYIISTANCSVIAKGTCFSVSYRENRTEIAISEGKVTVSFNNKKTGNLSEEIILETGSRAVVTDHITTGKIQSDEYNELSDFETLYSLESLKKPVRVKNTFNADTDNRSEKIDKLISQKTKTLKDIKIVFDRLDMVTLFSGQVITGAIISNGNTYSIITTKGMVNVPASDIRSFEILK